MSRPDVTPRAGVPLEEQVKHVRLFLQGTNPCSICDSIVLNLQTLARAREIARNQASDKRLWGQIEDIHFTESYAQKAHGRLVEALLGAPEGESS